jgi:hypothetical protein
MEASGRWTEALGRLVSERYLKIFNCGVTGSGDGWRSALAGTMKYPDGSG